MSDKMYPVLGKQSICFPQKKLGKLGILGNLISNISADVFQRDAFIRVCQWDLFFKGQS